MTKKKARRRPVPRRPPGPVPGGPVMRTPEGDLIVFCSALYRHGGMGEILEILMTESDFDPGELLEPGPDGEVQFGWFEVGPGKHPLPAAEGRRVLASLNLTPEILVVETMSEERLARCRRRLEHLLGDRLHLLGTQTKSLAQALAEGQPQDAPEPLVMPPEMIAGMEEQMLRQWIDESIPALDGMTPRQAVQTPEGRQKVLDLLAYIERQQAEHPLLPGMFSPDYRKTKKMLGLE